MPGKNVFFAIGLICGLCLVIGCSDKESPIVEKKFTSIQLNAFTVNTYRFRVNLNNDVTVTDSLMTPVGQVAKEILFDEYSQRIKVYNTSDETLLIDTPYTLQVAKINAFTIYQTEAGSRPFYLAPSPAEPGAKTGNVKVSFIPTGEELSDSVKVVLEIQNKRLDSTRVKKDNFSKYFEFDVLKDVKIRFYKIPGNVDLGEQVYYGKTFSEGFSILRLLYNGSPSLVSTKLY